MSMGYAAASHLDVVLGKIDALAKMDAKRSSGFLNFFKVHSFVQTISIAPPQVHYYSEALPTTALTLCRS